MCDYSLEHVASREAVVADQLVTTRFNNSITIGFSSKTDTNTAVCLRPGTELVFDAPPRYQARLPFWRKTAPSTVARFRQIDLHVPRTHHDALEFADGTIIPAADLFPGQNATILQLPPVAQLDHKADVAAQTDIEVVLQ
jgi:hypothetical protein